MLGLIGGLYGVGLGGRREETVAVGGGSADCGGSIGGAWVAVVESRSGSAGVGVARWWFGDGGLSWWFGDGGWIGWLICVMVELGEVESGSREVRKSREGFWDERREIERGERKLGSGF